MRRLVPLLVALVAVPLTAAAPRFGPEVAVSAPQPVAAERVMGYASADILNLASNGSMAMAVWQERRAADESDIFAARIDAAGHVLDPWSIAVTATDLYEEKPHVVWNGHDFVLVWNSVKTSVAHERFVWTATLDTDGHFVQPPTSLGPGFFEDAAVSNGVVAIVFRDGDGNSMSAIHVMLLSGAAPPSITTVGTGTSSRVTATPSGFVVTWQVWGTSENQIHAARVASGGAVAMQDTLVASRPSSSSFVEQSLTTRGEDVYVTAGGSAFTLFHLAPTGGVETLTTTAFDQFGYATDILATDSGFTALVFPTVGPTRGYIWHLSPTGALVDSTPVTATPEYRLKMTPLRGRIYIVSASATPTQPTGNVYGQFADERETHLISAAAENQRTPVLATDGDHLLAVWTVEHGYGDSSTRGALLGLDGRPLGEPFDIFPNAQHAAFSTVVFDGSDYLVARIETLEASEQLYQGLVATHVSRNGVPRGDRIIVSRTASLSAPSLASDGRNVLITWTEGGLAHATAALLTPGGLAAPFDLGAGSNLSVAWNGRQYAAVAVNSQHPIIAHISSDGALLGETTVDSIADAALAVIASNGDGFLIACATPGGVLALTLDRDAQPIAAPRVISQPAQPNVAVSDLRLAWNGTTYDAAWSEQVVNPFSYFHDAYGARVAPDGVRASDVYPLSVTPFDDRAPFPLGIGGGQTVMAYERMVAELGQSERVFTRASSPPPRTRVVRH